ncbi:DUF554 domain-containing protein [Celerinatantimonas sp. MCCC 1A17872]|uniref:DUF554 domain-containing protein n=1 Tax=Celerinatantimonas sp. MCCC 1A17872 TaxID=3177514 RepID=UPI0038C05AF2
MIIGPYINGSAVLIGGVIGAGLSHKIPERVKRSLPLTLGACSMGMGIIMLFKVQNLPAMVLALILGALIGELLYIEKGIGVLANKAKGVIAHVAPAPGDANDPAVQQEFLVGVVSAIVLFCASGTGVFGSIHEGMTGDPTILIAKSFLDLVTAAIFATQLGYIVSIICIPQLIIQLILAYCAVFIVPVATAHMNADFTAVGGLIMFVTGMRICKIKVFPIANMLPALILAMPISAYWEHFAHFLSTFSG